MRYVFLSACCFCLFACGSPAASPAALRWQAAEPQALSGGALDRADRYPEVGWLWAQPPAGDSYFFCTGTLIAPDRVLTAGHCLGEGWPEGLQALHFVPRTRPLPLGQGPVYAVVEAQRHPLYDARMVEGLPLLYRMDQPRFPLEFDAVQYAVRACQLRGPAPTAADMACLMDLPLAIKHVLQINDIDSQSFDVAVLRLDRPVDGVRPAALPRPDDALPEGLFAKAAAVGNSLAGAQLIGVGYGMQLRTHLWTKSSGERRFGSFHLDAVGPHEIHVSHQKAAAMPGDSGGPLFLERDGHRLLVGVASRGAFDPSAMPRISAAGDMVYVRVRDVLPWVDAAL